MKRETENLKTYKKRVDAALDNEFLRQAMDKFAIAYPQARATAFGEMDIEGLVREVAAIKARAMADNPRLLEEFIKNAQAAGAVVHRAETADQANEIIARIARESQGRRIIKSKSMTAEETLLNAHLEKEGLEVTESDLGEWIVQLRGEGPSHMVMPAIHLSRFQVADLFSRVTGQEQEEEIQHLVKVARRQLREKFVAADMGITGANFALADSGTIGIATNEGNARLTSTLPRVHVALLGMDKILPSLAEALTINRILPKNATGQAITSYVTWITGPTPCSTAPEGNREMHIVLLDNGRSRMAADPVFSQILQCVRCGACANVCPVYRMVGGHQLGHIYIGAMGLITTYFFHGRENAKNLVQNCTNCGACKAVCAGGIDLPKLIKEVHARIQDEAGHPLKSILLGKVLKNRKLFHGLLRTARAAQKPVTGGTPYLRHLPLVLSSDHNFRALPAIAEIPFRDRFAHLPQPARPEKTIALFAGCVQDFVYPEQLEAAMAGFFQAKVRVIFPEKQSCCGLPALMMGEKEAAREVALQNLHAFEALDGVDHIVTLCASCASHLKHGIQDLIQDQGQTPDNTRARIFGDRILSYSQFMDQLEVPRGKENRKTAFHAPCHLCRGLGEKQAPKALIENSGHTHVPTREEETCCGFGG
ncbi:MAG: LUD domain-containing protein, partial [Desulfobacterales bacterium]|nr:LUD domain-containing protein [Desulfobacterales bacterium]